MDASMWKNMGNKLKLSQKGSVSLPLYFTLTEPRSPIEADRDHENNTKMVPAITDLPPLMRQDLLDLGSDLKAHF